MDRPLFRTPVHIVKKQTLSAKQNFLFLGSCFSEEMSAKMLHAGLNVVSNPSGILFNPASISNTLRRIFKNLLYTDDDISKSGNTYFSWNHHGSYKSDSSEALLKITNDHLAKASEFVRDQNVLFLTWGSSIAYKLKGSNQVVANCHKHPGHFFDRIMLDPDEIVVDYMQLFEEIYTLHPGLKIIFTVSPVRYAKDGYIENQISKSVLFVALNKLLKAFPEQTSYFPAYEIVMDELRDYRFYKKDMIHPGEEAVDFIWEVLLDTYFGEADLKMISEIQNFRKMEQHRPLFPESEAHAKFLEKLAIQQDAFIKKYPHIKL